MVESYTHSKIENCTFCNAIGKIVGFGHLLKEDWFYPIIDFKNIEKDNRQF